MRASITQNSPPLPLASLVASINSFPNMDSAEKLAFLTRLVTAHVTLSLAWGPGWTFRRCRRLNSELPPGTVDDLIWRKDVAAALGRANPAGFDVLYVSDRQDTALCEARVTNDRVVISEFAIQQGHSVRVALSHPLI